MPVSRGGVATQVAPRAAEYRLGYGWDMILLIAAALAASPNDGPSYNDEWKQGYGEGREDADAMPLLKAGGLGAGAGLVLAGVGVSSCGVAGTPCIAAAVVVPAVAGWRSPAIPVPGPWEAGTSDYQDGYLQGYQETARQRQMKAALLGGAAGAVIGTGIGVGVIFAADAVINPTQPEVVGVR